MRCYCNEGVLIHEVTIRPRKTYGLKRDFATGVTIVKVTIGEFYCTTFYIFCLAVVYLHSNNSLAANVFLVK